MTENPPAQLPETARLLVGFATPADAAVLIPWAAALATALKLPLTLAHVLDPGRQREEIDVAATIAQDYLSLAATDQRLAGLPVGTCLRIGLPDEELPNLAREQPGTLLMLLGSEAGSLARSLLGAMSDAVLRALHTPFVIAPARGQPATTIKRLVLGDDGSALMARVLAVAHPLAGRLGIETVEVHAIEPDALATHAFLDRKASFGADRVVMHGRAAPALLAAAQARDAGLIVVGAHSHGPLARRLLGSTSGWLARHADRLVLVVPEPRP